MDLLQILGPGMKTPGSFLANKGKKRKKLTPGNIFFGLVSQFQTLYIMISLVLYNINL